MSRMRNEGFLDDDDEDDDEGDVAIFTVLHTVLKQSVCFFFLFLTHTYSQPKSAVSKMDCDLSYL
jgi:hypothetical protein